MNDNAETIENVAKPVCPLLLAGTMHAYHSTSLTIEGVREATRHAQLGAACIGSRCMAWRWAAASKPAGYCAHLNGQRVDDPAGGTAPPTAGGLG